MMKVLIVDGNERKRRKLEASLPPGAEADRADGSVRGLSLYSKARKSSSPYDLIISGSEEFMRNIRRIDRNICENTKFIFAANKNGFKSILEAYENGADLFMGPNITKKSMLNTLAMV